MNLSSFGFRTIEQTMEIKPDGARRLAAQLRTPASFSSLWSVLTDYETLSEFIPNLISSDVISKEGNMVQLRQVGSQDFFGLKFSAEVILDLEENQEDGLINFELIKGDFQRFEGCWRIKETNIISENSLIYDLTVKGCNWMPISMIEKRLRVDLSTNLLAVNKQALSPN
tara:strand:+ start:17129 stop:17638 length:510 start_codon:yes stop_codon:yes gene_type:complete